MSEFKGTPGPWVRHEPSGYQHSMGGYILGSGGKICDVSGFDVGSEAAKENAKLIAAAPELLEALRQLRDYVEDVLAVSTDDCDPQHPLIRATSVISKALGQ